MSIKVVEESEYLLELLPILLGVASISNLRGCIVQKAAHAPPIEVFEVAVGRQGSS